MNEKTKAAQAHIDGLSLSKAQMEFQSEFRDVYPFEVLASPFMAVGPMQSFLGFCVQRGYLTWEGGE